jgi:hypothetical protein
MRSHPTLGVREMRIKEMVTRLFAAATLAVTVAGGTVAVTASPALAAPTYCKTLNLSGNWAGFAINPRMTVPICYNGTSIWQSGNVTPGVSTVGWYVGGFDWAGTYGSGGGWLGVGENFTAITWANTFSTYCTPRWGINAWGNQVSYERNC